MCISFDNIHILSQEQARIEKCWSFIEGKKHVDRLLCIPKGSARTVIFQEFESWFPRIGTDYEEAGHGLGEQENKGAVSGGGWEGLWCILSMWRPISILPTFACQQVRKETCALRWDHQPENWESPDLCLGQKHYPDPSVLTSISPPYQWPPEELPKFPCVI